MNNITLNKEKNSPFFKAPPDFKFKYSCCQAIRQVFSKN